VLRYQSVLAGALWYRWGHGAQPPPCVVCGVVSPQAWRAACQP
jgi:hypothetical protein